MFVLDQRAKPRIPLAIFVNQEFDRADQRLGMTADVSVDGMSLFTLRYASPPKGRHAWVRFYLPGSEIRISALVEVVRNEVEADGESFGLRFKHLFPADRELLRGYLAARQAN